MTDSPPSRVVDDDHDATNETGTTPLRELSDRQLWIGCIVSVLAAVVFGTVPLWITGGAVPTPVRMLAGVGFWLSAASATMLAALALRLGVLVPPGNRRRAKTTLVVGLALALALVAVVGVATHDWQLYISISQGWVAVAGFASFALDALLEVLQVAAGFLIALAAFALLNSDERTR